MANVRRSALLALVLMAGVPVQASAQEILNTILDKVNDAVNAAAAARNAANAARASADEMRTRMQSGVGDLTGDLQTMMEEAAAEARRILAEENAGREAFLPGGNCASVCTDFRNDLIELLTNIETLSGAVVESTGLTADPDLSTLIESVRVAPGQVLFPLYRVTQALLASNLSTRLAEAAIDVATLSANVLNGPPDLPSACEVLMTHTQAVERGVKGVSVAAAIVKLVGKVFVVVGSTEFEGYAAGWGFVGGTIKSNKPKKVGEFLAGVSDGMSKVANYANGKLSLCASLAIQAANEAFQQATAQSLASIGASLGGLNLDLSNLDAPVSTRATQASVDGVDASIERNQSLMVRIQIERELAGRTAPMAVFYLPVPFGGLLDTVREVVEQEIVQLESTGQMLSKARELLSRGDAARAAGDYLDAYSWYREAYQSATAKHGQPGK
jgi:hypothetical protein